MLFLKKWGFILLYPGKKLTMKILTPVQGIKIWGFSIDCLAISPQPFMTTTKGWVEFLLSYLVL